MLKLNAAAFYDATVSLKHIASTIDARGLSSARQNEDGSVTLSALSDPVLLATLESHCGKLQTACRILGASVTAMVVNELRHSLSGSGFSFPTYDSVKDGIRDIEATLRRELTIATLLALNAKEREWYEPTTPLFGPDFETKFAVGATEVDEALKCLALGRSTASVFHLMRLMESGLKATALCLGLPPTTGTQDRNWGTILREVKAAMENKTKNRAWARAEDKDFFAEAYVSLDAVRAAWRNPTMHVERTYTDDQAEHVMLAAKGFMMKLTSRMDENGDPRA